MAGQPRQISSEYLPHFLHSNPHGVFLFSLFPVILIGKNLGYRGGLPISTVDLLTPSLVRRQHVPKMLSSVDRSSAAKTARIFDPPLEDR